MRWDTDAGPRLHEPERTLLRPQPHVDAFDRRPDLAAADLRQWSCTAVAKTFTLRLSCEGFPQREITSPSSSVLATAGASSRRSRAGDTCVRDAVGARRHRSRALDAAFPLGEVLKRAGLSRRAVDVMPSGLDATVVLGWCRLRARATTHTDLEGARRRTAWVLEMNGKPMCRPITASRCGCSCPAGSGWRTSSGSGRSRSPTSPSSRCGTHSSTS